MISLNLLFISLALGKVQAHSNHCSLQARFDDLGPEPRALETYGDIYDEVLSHRDLLPRAGPRPPGSPGVNPEAGPTTDETSEDKDEEYIRNGCKLAFCGSRVQWIEINAPLRSRRHF